MTPRPPESPEDFDALAGAFVLGTLEPWERAAMEARLLADPALAAAVAAWERRLAPLAQLVPPVSPSPALWTRIARDIAATPVRAAVPAADVVAPQAVTEPEPEPAVADPPPAIDLAAARESRAARLEASVRRWRTASFACGAALAACLAIIAVIAPAWFAAQRDDGRYTGIVNAGGAMPALVVSVDTRRGELKIRPLGIKPEAGKSHELWAVRGTAPPVSLGLVDNAGARGLAALPPAALADPALVLAVSVEPAGGSPTGQPTGPVVLTGKLFKEE